jgi:FKBP-type peptidyl-prolyl cis-trans isomerase FkpA
MKLRHTIIALLALFLLAACSKEAEKAKETPSPEPVAVEEPAEAVERAEEPIEPVESVELPAEAAEESEEPAEVAEEIEEPVELVEEVEVIEEIEIVPGLNSTILKTGDGRAAVAGDTVSVHYTGWLYDPTAEDNRGNKFDSSVDRGELFKFPLGAGRVIKGWDQGVEGMLIGEKRELRIAPELAYGNRGAGAVIPPGATLIFEIELFKLD